MIHHNPVLPEQKESLRALWWGWVAAPGWWLAQFEIRYAAVPWACHHGLRWLVLVIGTVAFLVSVALTLRVLRVRRRVTGEEPSTFLARGAEWAAIFFAVLVFVQLLPDLFLDPCRL